MFRLRNISEWLLLCGGGLEAGLGLKLEEGSEGREASKEGGE